MGLVGGLNTSNSYRNAVRVLIVVLGFCYSGSLLASEIAFAIEDVKVSDEQGNFLADWTAVAREEGLGHVAVLQFFSSDNLVRLTMEDDSAICTQVSVEGSSLTINTARYRCEFNEQETDDEVYLEIDRLGRYARKARIEMNLREWHPNFVRVTYRVDLVRKSGLFR